MAVKQPLVLSSEEPLAGLSGPLAAWLPVPETWVLCTSCCKWSGCCGRLRELRASYVNMGIMTYKAKTRPAHSWRAAEMQHSARREPCELASNL